MRKYLLFLMLPIMGLILASCDSTTTTDPLPVADKGSIFVQSTPSGAAIYVDGVNTQKVTPDTIKSLDLGSRNVKLILDGYYDTTFTVSVQKDLMSSPSPIVLRTNLSVVVYGPVRIYETTGTTSAQPSGLILSSGLTSSLSGVDMDLYYYSTANGSVYELRSADMHSGSTRNTTFYVSNNGTDLNDGVASPLATNSWVTQVPDVTSNYFFAFDNDLHYSKMQIVAIGGGTIGNPAWMDVRWIYNKVANDKRF